MTGRKLNFVPKSFTVTYTALCIKISGVVFFAGNLWGRCEIGVKGTPLHCTGHEYLDGKISTNL